MAHFAQIDNGIVTQVIVVANEDCGGGNFPQSEPVGQAFIASIGLQGEWLQTSYNSNFRGNFAAIGYMYDKDVDVFDRTPEAKAAEAALQAELQAKAEARDAILGALAAAAGLDVDEVKAALG